MTTEGKVCESRELRRGDVLSGIDASGVTLDNWWADWGPADSHRPLIENVRVRDLRLLSSSPTGCILRNVEIDGLRANDTAAFWNANQYDHVVLKGRTVELVLNIRHDDDQLEDEYLDVLRRFERETDWTLDISEIYGAVDIRGHCADKIRRDPQTQAIVRRENLRDGRWKAIDFQRTTYYVQIEMMMDEDWPDTILVADRSSRSLERELQVIQRLRDEGIADPA